MIDLRSDTITRPTKGMLEAMFNAKVGDDVLGDDNVVAELENKIAGILGMEAAVFCPSGIMANQIAIKAHTKPGDEVICDEFSHIYRFEGGGIALNSGCSVRLVKGDRGRIKAKDVLENINPDNVHFPVTSLVSLENTCNKGGGCCYNFNDIVEINKACRENNLKLHLDGARLFNALAETGEKPTEHGELFDSISICLSKGLGAPVGSVLSGDRQFIHEARRYRRSFGGGMRQAGYLAAAGIYALDNHIERLKEDHNRAKKIGNALKNMPYVSELVPVETNIIIFKLAGDVSENDFLKKLQDNGINAVTFGPQTIRMVTHLDFTDEMLEEVIEILKNI